MKLSINRKELVKALQQVKPFISTKAPLRDIPAFQQVLLKTNVDQLTITGTNLDNSIKVMVPCVTPSDCAIDTVCVQHKEFLASIKALTGDTVELYVTGEPQNVMSIMTGSGGSLSGLSIPTFDIEEYPQVKFPSTSALYTAVTPNLMSALSRAVKFTAKERIRITLTGVYLELGAESATVTATDGHRLSTVKVPMFESASSSYILQTFPIIQAAKRKVSWNILTEPELISFSAPGIEIASKTIDGPYPDYKQVIPDNSELDKTCIVERATLLTANNAILPCANKITNQGIYDFSPSGLHMSANNLDNGMKAEQSIGGTYTGDKLRIGLNINYLNDILNSIDSELITWALTSPTSASLIWPTENADELYLIMPLRLHE